MANIDDFRKLELKIAEIKEVIEHPNADRLYVIKVDPKFCIRNQISSDHL